MFDLQDYEVLYMVDPLDEICSQSIVDYEVLCNILQLAITCDCHKMLQL